MTVSVFDVVGEVCMTYEDGAKLNKVFVDAFERGDTVMLDFSRTRVFVTAFFNAAIGPLLKKATKDQLRDRLKIVNLSPAGIEPFRHSIENAERYYREPGYKEALDQVLKDISKTS
ncbi:MAG: STAS-like domain-containing protein [Methylacidiphilales bacterium]|nr:STAS-like domain-containing protein [Candidatus Methylacidiphilales bacterium]